MVEWKEWMGKRIFVKLNQGSVYSGRVIDVDDSIKPIIFITILDKFGKRVTFSASEIVKILEDEK